MQLHCRYAWVAGRWQSDVCIESDSSGWINKISNLETFRTTPTPQNDEPIEYVDGAVLPAMTNVHSHAFQWGFAGLSEFRSAEHDSFWTWRTHMFGFLEQLDADTMYAVACDLYRRMLRAGYCAVGEFHYVHTPPDGGLYSPPSLLSEVLIQAAIDTGISICMLPTLYQRGGFDGSPLVGGQRRFYLDEADFFRVLDNLLARYGDQPRVNFGMALHSLRAVDVHVGQRVVNQFRQLIPHGVIHIHAAEQTQEVDDCMAATGKRPVELLLDEFPVDEQWCLIHATQMTDDEVARLASRRAVVGLCPTTEANLGDGIFAAESFLMKHGGRIAIGGDSHVGINVAAELRQLECSQRLVSRRRAVLCSSTQSCGETLYDATSRGGAQALGLPIGEIAIGKRADFLMLLKEPNAAAADPSRTQNELPGNQPARWLDRFIFCDPTPIQHRVMIGGRWLG